MLFADHCCVQSCTLLEISADTDVFVLLLYYVNQVSGRLLFETGTSSHCRHIHVQMVAPAIGSRMCTTRQSVRLQCPKCMKTFSTKATLRLHCLKKDWWKLDENWATSLVTLKQLKEQEQACRKKAVQKMDKEDVRKRL